MEGDDGGEGEGGGGNDGGGGDGDWALGGVNSAGGEGGGLELAGGGGLALSGGGGGGCAALGGGVLEDRDEGGGEFSLGGRAWSGSALARTKEEFIDGEGALMKLSVEEPAESELVELELEELVEFELDIIFFFLSKYSSSILFNHHM